MKRFWISIFHVLYRILRPVIFCFDSERVHTWFTSFGQWMGTFSVVRNCLRVMLRVEDPLLKQTIGGISFPNPIGLAAGFDYEARLTQILPSVGFGFETIGTITNNPYEGNQKPRLGRLVRSRSLLVNKGFKNKGIVATLASLGGASFTIPVGMSIGKTNVTTIDTAELAIKDIVEAFRVVEASQVPFSYYELNISCPNLHGTLSFYDPQKFEALLSAVTVLNLSRPLWIKMPIEKTDDETKALLDVVVRYPVQAVIFGNLQKDRAQQSFDQTEIQRAGKGHFSGKPTWQRSNELIALAYRDYGTKLKIVGCGGVFSAEDAYTKIRLGASLVQLVTGLVFEGPQLPAAINAGLITLLRRDGFASIKDAVGADFS